MPPSSANTPNDGLIVTRFAPSPTGHLHIGGARTALFCWAFARRMGGHFLLRIEDTDQARSSDEAARGIMEDLAWLGIEWDEGPTLQYEGRTIGGDPRGVGPFFQARRIDLYNEHIMRLVEQGKAYPAFETAEELEAKRKAAMAAKQTYRYDRAALAIPLPERLKRMEAGEPHVVRLMAPAEEVVVHDEVLGDVRYAAGEMDDFVIRKADGFPTYHFAVVVDDETMGITHVLRAQEHLNNTPRHVALQRALGFRTPVYAHMPIISNMDSTKMSKRDKAKAARAALDAAMKKNPALTPAAIAGQLGLEERLVADFLAKENDSLEVAAAVARVYNVALPEIEVSDFRDAGYLPEAIVNFIALLGWNPGMKLPDGKDLEKFDAKFLTEHFSLERIGKTSAKFDRNKLLSFNQDALAALGPEGFAQRWRRWCEAEAPEVLARLTPERFAILAEAVRPRAKTFRDALKPAAFALVGDTEYAFDDAAVKKVLLAPGKDGAPRGLDLLRDFASVLRTLPEWTPAAIEGAMNAFVQERSIGPGQIAQPIRVAVTGSTVSPGIGATLAALGHESAMRRIERCLSEISASIA